LTIGAGFRLREALGYLDRALPITQSHDYRQMEEWLINLNKSEDDQRCFNQFCNILKWSATVQGKSLKGCLEGTVHYDSITLKV
jgi:hypothetical protein